MMLGRLMQALLLTVRRAWNLGPQQGTTSPITREWSSDTGACGRVSYGSRYSQERSRTFWWYVRPVLVTVTEAVTDSSSPTIPPGFRDNILTGFEQSEQWQPHPVAHLGSWYHAGLPVTIIITRTVSLPIWRSLSGLTGLVTSFLISLTTSGFESYNWSLCCIQASQYQFFLVSQFISVNPPERRQWGRKMS